MKALVTYFSAGGATERVGNAIAKAIGADIFEIRPVEPYTKADLNYLNPMSRCNREKIGKKDVPINGRVENIGEYDAVFVGFPIWYGGAPNVVKTFLKGYDLSGKKVVVFATSAASPLGKSAEKLAPFVPGAEIPYAKRVKSPDEAADWAKGLKL